MLYDEASFVLKYVIIFTNNYLPINEAKYLHIFLQATSTSMFIKLLHNSKSFSHKKRGQRQFDTLQ